MKEKIFFLVLFFGLVPVLIISELVLLGKISSLPQLRSEGLSVSAAPSFRFENLLGEKVLSYRDQKEGKISANLIGADARPILIERYLSAYNSPLAEFSELIFDSSQQYGLDYRLTTAIAQQESNLCKKSPPNCFNCWGVGIHSRGTMCFDSYPEAIIWVAKYLRQEYLDKGLETPEEIMSKYCPLSNGSWAVGVKQFMAELE
ncbi:MAG: hypothetical protein ABH867_02165 [Patescibacteria group bacterium]|nr:hypothetical protein [Patescibacteria group bacterium]